MSKVCIAMCDDYERKRVEEAVSAALDELKAERLFRPGEKILLKPNILSGKAPEKAATTHPEVIRAVAVKLMGYGLELSYGDSPAVESLAKASAACGIRRVMEELSVPAADFEHSFTRECSAGESVRSFQLVKAVADTDGIVNICKFKTHAFARYTGALKNLFGLIPGLLKAKDHVRFPDEIRFTDMLADLNRCAGARLHVTDAVVAMEGNGPANGDPRKLRMILASDDPVALDSVCVAIMDADPAAFPIIMTADRRGLGTSDLSRIRISLIGQPGSPESIRRADAPELLPGLAVRDFRRAVNGHRAIRVLNTPVGTFLKKLVVNRPAVIPENCTKCGFCVKVCPVEPKAICFSEENQRIEYRYDRCIRCFCCQELCPHAAIRVVRAPLNFILTAPYKRKER